jgi:predicted nucleic acid-binding protein
VTRVLVFYVDASCLAKRYATEVGTPLINHLFHLVGRPQLKVLNIGLAELVAVMTRKRNAGLLTPAAFAQVLVDLGAEVVSAADLEKLPTDEALVRDARPLVVRHSLNATDAILLKSALGLALALRAGTDDLVLVAPDHRLLRAAQAEGLTTFDPETQTQADLDHLIGP